METGRGNLLHFLFNKNDLLCVCKYSVHMKVRGQFMRAGSLSLSFFFSTRLPGCQTGWKAFFWMSHIIACVSMIFCFCLFISVLGMGARALYMLVFIFILFVWMSAAKGVPQWTCASQRTTLGELVLSFHVGPGDQTGCLSNKPIWAESSCSLCCFVLRGETGSHIAPAGLKFTIQISCGWARNGYNNTAASGGSLLLQLSPTVRRNWAYVPGSSW